MRTSLLTVVCLLCSVTYIQRVWAEGQVAVAEANLALRGRAGSNGTITEWGGVPFDIVVSQINDGETGWSPTTAFHGNGTLPSYAWISWDKPYRISRVVVHHASAGNLVKNFGVDTLRPGGDVRAEADWQPASDVKDNSQLVTTNVFAAPVVTAGIRIRSADQGLVLEELEAFGNTADGSPLDGIAHAPPLLRLRPFPAAHFVDVEVDLRAQETFARSATAQVTILRDGDEAALVETRIVTFSNVVERVRVDTSAMKPGRYRVQALMTIGGQPQPVIAEILEIPAQPEWMGNAVGLTDRVPEPWTPLRVDKRHKTISCWGRGYTFDAAVGFSQISILGQPFLAGPTRLTIQRNGRQTLATGGRWRIVAANGSKVAFVQESSADGVKVTAESWIEFDGLVWTKLTLSGPAVERVSLELPVRRDMAKLWCEPTWHLHPATGLAPTETMFLEPTEGAAQRGNFMRLGTDERGVQWCRESLKGWRLGDRSKAIGLIPRDSEYVMQFNFVNTPTDLARPLTIEYGWQALPVRPRPTGWRTPYWGGLQSRSDPPTLFNEPEVYMYTERWNGRWNYWNHWNADVFGADAPAGATIEALRQQFQDNWALRKEVMNLYCNVAATDGNTPEYRLYERDWTSETGKYLDYSAIKGRDQVVMASVCPAAASYRDFYVYYLDKSLRALQRGAHAPPMGALYFDVPMVWSCNNRAHGCDGVTPVLGVREYMKRIYTACKAISPSLYVTVHNSGMPWMATYAFADIMVEGEQFASAWEGRLHADATLPADYTRLLTPDILRAEFQSSLWGPQSMFLTEQWIWYARIKDWGREPHPPLEQSMRHISGLLLAHDILMWGNPAPDPWIQRALRRWGWDDRVEFLPYWRNAKHVRADTGGVTPVLISLFKRPAGLIAVVMNDSDREAFVQIELDLNALGLGDAGFYRACDVGHPPLKTPSYAFREGRVERVRVPARDYVMLQFIN
ncbi:MAG: DUF6067 family protein [Kiritimatiellae bacterium]|nr:DUF6067 family protein [Kiritimatiellia bacterium]